MADNQIVFNADINFDQSKIQQRVAQLEQKLKFSGPFGTMTKDVTNFNYQLDRATQRVVTLGTAFSVLATANRLIRGIVDSTVAVEKSLASVNTIFKLTNENLTRFSSSLFDISRETATSFDKVAEAAQEFARQGLSVAETQKAVRAALLLSRDANIDVTESVRALTAATNSFSKEALSRLQIANRLASVDAAFAVSSKDLAEALIRTGSAAADAGVSFNQFIGLVTAAQQITQRGGSVIAGALNTIFTRVNRKDTLDALDSLGIAITDVRGQALPTIQVLQNFALAYDKMTGSIKNQAAELVGGVRQLNTLKGTLKDLATQGSVFAQVQDVIARNSNEIERRNAERNKTFAALGSQAVTTGQQIGSNIGQSFSGPLKPFLSQVLNNPVTDALKDANGSAESMGGKIAQGFLSGFGSAVVFGLGPIILKVLTSITTQVGGNLLKDIAAISGLNSQEKERAAIEAQIVELYKAGGVALQQQLAAMTTLTERAALVRSMLGGAGTNYVPASAIAAELQATGGLSRRPRVPGMAGGYIPFAEESAAINAGVGGATAGARPVLLNGFNFGGGKVGSIVANTSEYLVPHMAGGSAILNQNMIRAMGGLPPGSRPIAAGGYVPHAAGGLYDSHKEPIDWRKFLAIVNAQKGPEMYGPPAPEQYGPPTLKQWKAAGGKTPEQIMQDIGRAQEQELKAQKAQERVDAQILKAKEKIFATHEKQNEVEERKVVLTKADLATSEKVAAAQIEVRAMIEAKWKEISQRVKNIATAPFNGTPPSAFELRGIPGTNKTPEGRALYNPQAFSGTVSAENAAWAEHNAYLLKMEREASKARLAAINGPSVATAYGGGSGGGRGWGVSAPGPVGLTPAEWAKLKAGNALATARSNPVLYGSGPQLAESGFAPNGEFPFAAKWTRAFNPQIAEAGPRYSPQMAESMMTPNISRNSSSMQMAEAEATMAMGGAPRSAFLRWLSKTGGNFRGDAGPSLLSRVAGRVNSPGGSLMAGLGLPFLAGLLPDGQGGTAAGVGLGAAKTAGQYGGTGAVFGSFAGPQGALPGLVIGTVVGALVGAISKSTKSFEELSLELDQKNKKLSEEMTNALDVFRIQGDLNDALSSGNVERVKELRQERAQQIGRVTDPRYRAILDTRLNDPGAAADLARIGNSQMLPSVLSANLMTAMKPGEMSRINPFAGQFTTGKENSSAVQAISAAIAGMSAKDIGALRKTATKDPDKALIMVAHAAGMDPDQLSEMMNAPRSPNFVQDTILRAARFTQGGLGVKATQEAGDIENLRRERQLIQIAGGYRTNAAYAGITGGANAQIAQARNQIALSNPMLTDIGRLQLQGSQGTASIAAQFGTQRVAELFSGKAGLIDQANKDKVPKALTDRIEGAKSLADLQRLAGDLSTPESRNRNGFQNLNASGQNTLGDNSPFRKELEALIDKLQESTFAEQENTRANNASNKLQLDYMQFLKTRAGAATEYGGASLNAGLGLRDALRRNDTPDILLQKIVTSRTADLNRRFQQGGTVNRLMDSSVLDPYDTRNRSGTPMPGGLGFKNWKFPLGSYSGSTNPAMTPAQYYAGQLEIQTNASATSRLNNASAVRALLAKGSRDITGGEVESGLLGGAAQQGLQGNSIGSLTGGFKSVFAGLKQELNDFSSIGKAVADSLNNSLGNAFGDFITGAKSGKDAFRGFAVSVLGDASRMLASKAVSQILGSFLGGVGGSTGGEFTGNSFHFASGGTVPAMLMGGEYVVGPNAARRIGYDTLRRMNGMAEGGMVRGGSGVKDDVPARLAPGTFVMKRSATSRLGAGYMDALVGGQVQHRDIGGIILGALLGGGVGYATGGKKGAIGGALLGGIGGYLAGQGTHTVTNEWGETSSVPGATLSVGQKIALGLGTSAGAGLLAAGIGQDNRHGALNDSQLNGYRQSVEAAQVSAFNNRPSPYPILQVGPQGQSYLTGYTDGPATRRWADGGGVDVPLTVGSAQAKSSGGASAVSVKIDIHNNGSTTATSSANGGGGGAFQGDFANKLQKTVQGLVQQEIVNQSRSDGFFSQSRRFVSR